MKVIAVDGIEHNGALVPCRWCDGYGRYDGQRWIYADQDIASVRADMMASEAATDARERSYTRILGRERQR